MSLINDALKRAQQESSGSSPTGGPPLIPVQGRAPGATVQRSGAKDAIVVAVAFVVLVGLAAGALVFFVRITKGPVKGDRSPVPTRPIAAATAPVVTPSPAATPKTPVPPPAKKAAGSVSPAAQAAAAGNLIPAPVSSLGRAWRQGESVAHEVAAFQKQADIAEDTAPTPAQKPLSAPPAPTPAPAEAPAKPTSPPIPPPTVAHPPPAPVAATPAVQPPIPAPAPPPALAAASHAPSAAALALKSKYRLSGIVTASTGNMALINNEVLRRGDRLDGATITAIEANHVVMQIGNESVELRVSGLP